MRLGLATLAMACSMFATPALACRTDLDCKTGTQCIDAHVPGGRLCAKNEAVHTHPLRKMVTGQPVRAAPVRRNHSQAGEACRSDRDCAVGKTCTRPDSNSEWRCVPR